MWDKSEREDGTFSRSDFTFDKERDVYICPAGKLLQTTGTVHDGGTLLYRACKLDCDACPRSASAARTRRSGRSRATSMRMPAIMPAR